MSAGGGDPRRSWLKKALGLDLPEGGVAITTADYTKRLMTISQDAAVAGVQGKIAEQLKAAAVALRAGDPGAVNELDALEVRVADLNTAAADRALAPEADAALAAATADSGKIERLRAALATARGEIAQVPATLNQACSAYAELIGGDKEAEGIASGDEDDIVTIAAAAGNEVPPFEEVADTLDEIIGEMADAADDAARQTLVTEAVGEIDAYRAQLTDPILTEMEETDAGSYRIRSAIDESLDALVAELRA